MENELAKLNSILRSKTNKALLAGALTHGLNMSRFLKCAWIQVTTSPDIYQLAQKNPTTVFRAMLQCAQMGLYPDGVSGDAYLVRFGNECVAIRGYKGKMRLFGENKDAAPLPFVADVVREKDEWDYELGGNPKLHHKPAKNDRGDITHYYAVARFIDGTVMPKVMSVEEVEKYKGYAKTKKFWDSEHENTRTWMRIKTVIHQLMKSLPLAERVRDEVQREEALESGAIEVEAYMEMNGGEQPHVEGGDIKKTQGKAKPPEVKTAEKTTVTRVKPNEAPALLGEPAATIVTGEPVDEEPPPGEAYGDKPEAGGPDPFTSGMFDE